MSTKRTPEERALTKLRKRLRQDSDAFADTNYHCCAEYAEKLLTWLKRELGGFRDSRG